MTTITRSCTCISRMQTLHLFACLWLVLLHLPQNTGKNTVVTTARECYTGSLIFKTQQCKHDSNHTLMNIKDAHYEASSCSLEPECIKFNNATDQPECEVHVPTVDQRYYSALQTKCGGEKACTKLHAQRKGYPDCPNCSKFGQPHATDQIRIDFTCEKDLPKEDLCPVDATSYFNITNSYLFKSWNGIDHTDLITENCMCTLHSDTIFELSIKRAYMQLKRNHSDCLYLGHNFTLPEHDGGNSSGRWYKCDGKGTSQDVLPGHTHMYMQVNLTHTENPSCGLIWLHIKAAENAPVTVKCWSYTLPTTTTAAPSTTVGGKQEGLDSGTIIAIAGTVAGIVLLAVVVAALIFYFRFRKPKKDSDVKPAKNITDMDTANNQSPTRTGQQTTSKDLKKTTNNLTNGHPDQHTKPRKQSHGGSDLQRQKRDNCNQAAPVTMTECKGNAKNHAYARYKRPSETSQYSEAHDYDPTFYPSRKPQHRSNEYQKALVPRSNRKEEQRYRDSTLMADNPIYMHSPGTKFR